MKELQDKLVLSKWSFSNRRATRTSGFESAPTESKDAMQAALMTNLVPQNFSWANIRGTKVHGLKGTKVHGALGLLGLVCPLGQWNWFQDESM